MNDPSNAQASFQQIKDKEYRAMAAPYLSEAMIKAGAIDKAFKLITEVPDVDLPWQLRILKSVGAAKAEQGDIKGAQSIADMTSKAGTDVSFVILSAIGRQKAKNSLSEDALAWAKSQSPGLGQLYAFLGVAEGLLDKEIVN